ncbi:MAG: GNAT family N-acetyltransferase [Candidatus Dormibacteraceae bacterium]
MATNQSNDALRFMAWQLAALEARPAGSDLLSVGPFRVVFPTEPGGSSWVTLVEGAGTQAEVHDAVGRLRSMFARREATLEIEFNESVAPHAAAWLEAAGMKQAERNPLMACRPDGFKPFAAPDVVLHRLNPGSAARELEVFQEIRWTEGGEASVPIPPVERLRKDLGSESSVFLLAWVEGSPAGTGVSYSLQGAGEIVGIVTRIASRRRGVAATVSSELVARHFASGGDFVFLDAANDAAARVYERLGFARFGANVVYR